MRTLRFWVFLLVASSTFAQKIPVKKDPAQIVSPALKTTSVIRGDVIVPIAKTDREQVKAGKIVWKRVVRRLPQNDFNPRRTTVWIENFSHPGPTLARAGEKDWLDHDPRRLRVTTRYIAFDAPAGDHIFYVVGAR